MENREINPLDTTCDECNEKVIANVLPVGADGITWAAYHCSNCGHNGKKQLLRTAADGVVGGAAGTLNSTHWIPW